MALLSQMFRTAAITGRTDTVNAWFADRQGGRWAEQTVRDAFPMLPPHAAPEMSAEERAKALRELEELRAHGDLTDAELERLRAGLYA